jgi:hypothetical protein
MTIKDDLLAATARAGAAAQILHDVANGPASGPGSIVVTGAGAVKSLARAVGDLEEAATGSAAAAAVAAAQVAVDKAVVAADKAAVDALAATATTQAGIATAQAAAASASSATAAGHDGTAAASAAAAHADRLLCDADVASTAANAAVASASAAIAAGDAASAAASAEAAIVAKINWRGTWSGLAEYGVGDAVALSGASYIAIAPNTNQPPPNPTYWDVLAAKGANGSGTGDMLGANNLADVADPAAARTNLGLGTAATTAAAAYATAAQGAKADSAAQKSANLSDLTNTAMARTNLGIATVGNTGAYADLTGKPTLGTAAALNADADATLASNSDSALPSQKAVKTYVATIPQNSRSAAYTTVLADAGKHIFHPSADTAARTITIDGNANVAYPIGTAITFVNQHGAGVVTIAIAGDTLRLAGAGTTGSRTLAADGMATALKITSTEWIISGTGLT